MILERFSRRYILSKLQEEWKMVEKRFYPRFLPQAETIFSVGNVAPCSELLGWLGFATSCLEDVSDV